VINKHFLKIYRGK